MKIYNCKQKTDEWLKIRMGKFTASEAQAIATQGKGLETLCFSKAVEIITNKLNEGYSNDDIERGNDLESSARNMYELHTGKIVKEIGFVELNEHIGCSPDGLVEDSKLIEIKCKNDVNFLKFMYDGKLDKAHYWQMQMQMWIMEVKECDYILYNERFENRLIITNVKRNDEDIKKLILGCNLGIELLNKILTKVR